MINGIEDYREILEESSIKSLTIYLNNEEDVKLLTTTFEKDYKIKKLSKNELPSWASNEMGLEISKLEKETASVGGMGQ